MTTPFGSLVFKIGMDNKKYGINFEIATPQLSPRLLFFVSKFLNNSNTLGNT
jgi:hypothetical protein